MPGKVAILISSMRCGGAERVAALTANGLCGRGHAACILTLSGPDESFYRLAHGVRLVPLGLMSSSGSPWEALAANGRRLLTIRNALRRLEPDVVLSSMTETNVLTIVATRLISRLPCPLVACEHNYPPRQELAAPWPVARRAVYPLADAVVSCGLGVGAWFERWLPASKLFPIQNPVVLEDRGPDRRAERMAEQMARERWVLAMGKLVRQKGFDLLLEAYARVPRAERQGWKLGIVGEGPLHSDLEAQVDSLGLQREAVLLGRFANPLPLLRACGLFVLSSRYEGLPLCLQEAMACGAPVLSFDCPVGPAEVVRPEVDGLLVPPGDVGSLSAAMSRLMREDGLRARLGAAAPRVLDRFSLDRYLDRWERLIGSLTGVVRPPGAAGAATAETRS